MARGAVVCLLVACSSRAPRPSGSSSFDARPVVAVNERLPEVELVAPV